MVLATVGAIELASLVGRLGVPMALARQRRLDAMPDAGGVSSGLPSGMLLVTSAGSVVIAVAAWLATDLPAGPLVVGSAAITLGQNLGGWHRGAGRFLLASLAHPVPALCLGVIALIVDPVGGRLPWWYVAGAVAASMMQLTVACRELARPGRLMRSLVDVVATGALAAAGIANQALLLAVPVVLVGLGHPATATVLTLAIGAYRPLGVLQFGLNFTVGPTVAGLQGRVLDDRQRGVLDRASGLQQLALIPYLLVAAPAVFLVSTGLGSGHSLPALLGAWLVLLAGHVVAFGTGPTGQLLMMRGHERDTVVAATAGLIAGLLCFLVPTSPWLRGAASISSALMVQNAMTARRAWMQAGWWAHPRIAIPLVLGDLAALRPTGARYRREPPAHPKDNEVESRWPSLR